MPGSAFTHAQACTLFNAFLPVPCLLATHVYLLTVHPVVLTNYLRLPLFLAVPNGVCVLFLCCLAQIFCGETNTHFGYFRQASLDLLVLTAKSCSLEVTEVKLAESAARALTGTRVGAS